MHLERMQGDGRAESPEQDRNYSERAAVSGFSLRISWNEDYKDYTLYISKPGHADRWLRTSKDPKLAKEIFDYAANLAGYEFEIEDLNSKTSAYADRILQ